MSYYTRLGFVPTVGQKIFFYFYRKQYEPDEFLDLSFTFIIFNPRRVHSPGEMNAI